MKNTKVNVEKVVAFGVGLGYVSSMLYLMLTLVADITA